MAADDRRSRPGPGLQQEKCPSVLQKVSSLGGAVPPCGGVVGSCCKDQGEMDRISSGTKQLEEPPTPAEAEEQAVPTPNVEGSADSEKVKGGSF